MAPPGFWRSLIMKRIPISKVKEKFEGRRRRRRRIKWIKKEKGEVEGEKGRQKETEIQRRNEKGK